MGDLTHPVAHEVGSYSVTKRFSSWRGTRRPARRR